MEPLHSAFPAELAAVIWGGSNSSRFSVPMSTKGQTTTLTNSRGSYTYSTYNFHFDLVQHILPHIFLLFSQFLQTGYLESEIA